MSSRELKKRKVAMPPASPRGAPPSPAGPPPSLSGASSSTAKGKREKRVRSASRKRGSRGMGGKLRQKEGKEAPKKKGQAAKAPVPPVPLFLPNPPPQPAQAAGPPAQPVGMLPTHMRGPMTPQTPPVKRKRERKHKYWKPWSEQTWEERLEREKYQERKAAEREAQQSLPLVRPIHFGCCPVLKVALCSFVKRSPCRTRRIDFSHQLFRARGKRRRDGMSCRCHVHPATPLRRS